MFARVWVQDLSGFRGCVGEHSYSYAGATVPCLVGEPIACSDSQIVSMTKPSASDGRSAGELTFERLLSQDPGAFASKFCLPGDVGALISHLRKNEPKSVIVQLAIPRTLAPDDALREHPANYFLCTLHLPTGMMCCTRFPMKKAIAHQIDKYPLSYPLSKDLFMKRAARFADIIVRLAEPNASIGGANLPPGGAQAADVAADASLATGERNKQPDSTRPEVRAAAAATSAAAPAPAMAPLSTRPVPAGLFCYPTHLDIVYRALEIRLRLYCTTKARDVLLASFGLTGRSDEIGMLHLASLSADRPVAPAWVLSDAGSRRTNALPPLLDLALEDALRHYSSHAESKAFDFCSFEQYPGVDRMGKELFSVLRVNLHDSTAMLWTWGHDLQTVSARPTPFRLFKAPASHDSVPGLQDAHVTARVRASEARWGTDSDLVIAAPSSYTSQRFAAPSATAMTTAAELSLQVRQWQYQPQLQLHADADWVDFDERACETLEFESRKVTEATGFGLCVISLDGKNVCANLRAEIMTFVDYGADEVPPLRSCAIRAVQRTNMQRVPDQ